MKMLITDYKSQVEEIADLVVKGIESWYRAGEKLCALVDADPTAIDRICADVPMLTPNVLRQLERIGRKQLLPELLLKNGPGWNRLRQMPFDVQRKFLNAPVEVLILTNDGPDTLRVGVENLTLSQAQQVFSMDGTVRDSASQRAWVQSRQETPLPPENTRPYSVHGRNLVITKPCKLTIQEIGVILAEMKT